MNRRKKSGRQGSELVEFALVSSLFIAVLFWTFSVGISLTRSLQVGQLSRDTGHMYARNVDFSESGNRQIVLRLAEGLPITDSGGDGVVILSKIMLVGQPECDAAGLHGTACTNLNQPVFLQRITIGNAAARGSAFGDPPSALLGAGGNVSAYLTDSRARAAGFTAVLAMNAGEFGYVSEVSVPGAVFPVPWLGLSGVYARNIF